MGELLLAKVFFKKYHSPIYIYIYINFVTLATKFLQIIYFFSTSNLIEMKQYQFSWPTVELAKTKHA